MVCKVLFLYLINKSFCGFIVGVLVKDEVLSWKLLGISEWIYSILLVGLIVNINLVFE